MLNVQASLYLASGLLVGVFTIGVYSSHESQGLQGDAAHSFPVRYGEPSPPFKDLRDELVSAKLLETLSQGLDQELRLPRPLTLALRVWRGERFLCGRRLLSNRLL